MHPMPGYLIATLEKKKKLSKLEVLEEKPYSDIVVKELNKEDEKTVPFKVGSKIYIHPASISPRLEIEEQGFPCLVPIKDIMAWE